MMSSGIKHLLNCIINRTQFCYIPGAQIKFLPEKIPWTEELAGYIVHGFSKESDTT